MTSKQLSLKDISYLLILILLSCGCGEEAKLTHELECLACTSLPPNSAVESVALEGWEVSVRTGYDSTRGEFVRASDGSQIIWMSSYMGSEEVVGRPSGFDHHLFFDGVEFFLTIEQDDVAKMVKLDGRNPRIEIQASSPEKLGELIFRFASS